MFVRLRYFRFVAALATLTSLAACSKDDPKPAADPMGMSWTVDGSNVTATMTEKTVSATEIQLQAGAGSAASASVVQLSMPNKVGTYDLANSDATALYATGNSVTGTGYLAESGTITISSLTATNVTGTFTFKGEDVFTGSAAKTITNGKFNIAL